MERARRVKKPQNPVNVVYGCILGDDTTISWKRMSIHRKYPWIGAIENFGNNITWWFLCYQLKFLALVNWSFFQLFHFTIFYNRVYAICTIILFLLSWWYKKQNTNFVRKFFFLKNWGDRGSKLLYLSKSSLVILVKRQLIK